jgi:hypothetical protein
MWSGCAGHSPDSQGVVREARVKSLHWLGRQCSTRGRKAVCAEAYVAARQYVRERMRRQGSTCGSGCGAKAVRAGADAAELVDGGEGREGKFAVKEYLLIGKFI